MTKQSELFSNLRVASPCHVGWERMRGDDRVRFCDSCQLNVYNFSELTSDEIYSLVMKTSGRKYGRLYRRTDGTIITRDCPVGLRALKKRVARKTTAIFAAILSLGTAVFAQSKNDTKQSCKVVQTITLQREKVAPNQSPGLSGIVTDPTGAVIPNARVMLLSKTPASNQSVVTDDNGQFALEGLRPGTYKLRIVSPGFKTLEVKKLKIRAAESARATLSLFPNREMEVVGIIMSNLDIEHTNGTTIIGGDILRRLPIRN